MIGLHVGRSISLVIEQSFERGTGEEFLGRFAGRATLVQVACHVSKATLLDRFARRIQPEPGQGPTPRTTRSSRCCANGRFDHASFAPLDLDAPMHLLGCEDIGTPEWERRVEDLAECLIGVL